VENLEIGRTIEGGGEASTGGGEGCGGGYTVSLGKGTTKDAEMGNILVMFKVVAAAAVLLPTGGGTVPQAGAPATVGSPDMQDIAREAYKSGVIEGRVLQTQQFNSRRTKD
jgi:hypothetical protein